MREKKPIALIHVRGKKPIALIHGRDKKSWHSSMGGKGYSHGCTDQKAVTEVKQRYCSKPRGLEETWNKHAKSKRKIVSSLILDKGKKIVSV